MHDALLRLPAAVFAVAIVAASLALVGGSAVVGALIVLALT